MRYVFDVNVVVSALLLDQSLPGKALQRGLRTGIILISKSVVEELDDVLRRPKFDRYVTLAERERFLTALIRRAEVVEVDQVIQACRDAQDNHILELAVCGKATAIVTGDADLLALNRFRNIPIVTPAAYLESASE